MDSRVATVLSLVDKQPRVDIVALSASVNLSPSRLRHLFRIEMSTSLCGYLKARRLLRAEQLLKTTFLLVKQVATASGFGDTNHFVREFHRAFGVPPAAYRRTAVSDSK